MQIAIIRSRVLKLHFLHLGSERCSNSDKVFFIARIQHGSGTGVVPWTLMVEVPQTTTHNEGRVGLVTAATAVVVIRQAIGR